ncbi:MAG: diguanylate cyclase [Paenisporosarcina sp.]
MLKHDETIIHIKSEMLDLWNENGLKNIPATEWFELFSQLLAKYFGVHESQFMLFDMDRFIPLNDNHSIEKKMESITWQQVSYAFSTSCVADLSKEYSSVDHSLDAAILFKNSKGAPEGLMLLKSTQQWNSFANSDYIEEFSSISSYLVSNVKKQIYVAQQEKQYRELFNVTEMFHSTMDIDRILEGVLLAMNSAFPSFKTDLVLSNDQDRQMKIRVKLFDYLSERPAAIEAFVSGEITVEHACDLNCRILNAPIKGRQGIYGILQVKTPEDYLFSNRQQDFIRMLANTSGNALENAKLYHQSHRLIADLQLINETSHKLNMNLKLEEMLQFLQKQLTKSFHPMQSCFVFINGEEMEITTLSPNFIASESGQMYISHISEHFQKSGDSLFIADFNKHTDEKVPYHSLMAVPLFDQQEIFGYCFVLHEEAYFFSFESFKLMQSLIHHCTLAITNSKLRDQLQDMVDRDHLTKLYARSYLDQYVEDAIEKELSGVFILLDIDNFKQVNDTYGHQVGDKILVQIAQLLDQTIGGKGIGARWGGEELAVFLPHFTQDEGKNLGQTLVEMVPKMTNPPVTISSGLASWQHPAQDAFHDVFHAADTALYEAKKNGKNQLRIFESNVSS